MATKKYTQRTAYLRATKADIGKLTINGKNLSEAISTTVKSNVYDARGKNTKESDLWSQKVNKLEDGSIVLDDSLTIEPSKSEGWFQNNQSIASQIVKIENKKAYDEDDNLVCNIETDAITYGKHTFYGVEKNGYKSNIQEINSDFTALKSAEEMFAVNNALTSFSGNLYNLTDGSKMFVECRLLSDFNSDLYNLNIGFEMFKSTGIKNFSVKMPNLTNGQEMFYGTPLESFNSDATNLTNGKNMFKNITTLKTVDGNFPKLEDGEGMFYGTTSFVPTNFNLQSLTKAKEMFYGNTFEYFNFDLPELNNGYGMFMVTPTLKAFAGDLSKLTNGSFMFYISANKIPNPNFEMEFISDLSSLQTGYYMFYNKPLTEKSFECISDTINDVREITEWDSSIEDSSQRRVIHLQMIKENVNIENIEKYCNEIVNKGWIVYLNSTSIEQNPDTPGLEGIVIDDETPSPAPVHYYKAVEVSEEYAEYTDGNKFYILLGAEYVFGDDLSTYGQFTSLDNAITQMGLTAYKNV